MWLSESLTLRKIGRTIAKRASRFDSGNHLKATTRRACQHAEEKGEKRGKDCKMRGEGRSKASGKGTTSSRRSNRDNTKAQKDGGFHRGSDDLFGLPSSEKGKLSFPNRNRTSLQLPPPLTMLLFLPLLVLATASNAATYVEFQEPYISSFWGFGGGGSAVFQGVASEAECQLIADAQISPSTGYLYRPTQLLCRTFQS